MAGPSNDLDVAGSPQRGFQSAVSALNTGRSQTDKDIKAEQEEMKPALKEASDLIATPRPQLGKMEKVPDEPGADTGKPGQEWILATAVLAGIAGAFSRQHLTSALTAFGAGVQGLRQGQVQAYDQAFKKWQAAAEKAKANNAQVLEEYKAAFEDRKASMEEIRQRIELTAIKYKDRIMEDAARRGEDTLMAQVYSQQVNAQREFGLQSQRLKDEHAKFEQTVLDKYGLTSEQFGEAQKRLFDETKASAPPGETQQQFMQRYQEAWKKAGIGMGGQSAEMVADLIGQGKMAPLSSFALRSPWGQQVMAIVGERYPNFSGTEFRASSQTETSFATGRQGDQVRAINVAIDHLGTADELVNALRNNNVQRFNQFANRWAVETGSTAPTNLQTAGRIIGQEMVKAVVSGGGGVTERTAAEDAFSDIRSPDQLHQAIQTVRRLMAGQLQGLERQYSAGTGGRRDFDETLRLSPQAREALRGLSSGEQGGKTQGGASDGWFVQKVQ